MKYCKLCVQPDTRPQSQFTSDGICPACVAHRDERHVDWNHRLEEMRKLIKRFRKPNDSGFDCVVGVSGGKDSTRQALYVREKLGLNPLLVSLTYPPQQLSHLGASNLSNLVHLGFSVETRSVAPRLWKEFAKLGFQHFANWCIIPEAILYSTPVIAAREYGINMVFFGENDAQQAGDQGVFRSHWWNGNGLFGLNTLRQFRELSAVPEIRPITRNRDYFLFSEQDSWEVSDVQVLFMGGLWFDWSAVKNGSYAVLEGLSRRLGPPSETGDIYGIASLDEDWVVLNQMIKYYKYGFGRTTEYMCENIREGRHSREEAIDLVTQFDGACSDENISTFCSYIELDVEDFWDKVHSVTNKALFSIQNAPLRPKPRFTVGLGIRKD